MSFNGYHAIVMLSSLIVRRWVRPQSQLLPWRKALIGCDVSPPWFNLSYSLARTIC